MRAILRINVKNPEQIFDSDELASWLIYRHEPPTSGDAEKDGVSGQIGAAAWRRMVEALPPQAARAFQLDVVEHQRRALSELIESGQQDSPIARAQRNALVAQEAANAEAEAEAEAPARGDEGPEPDPGVGPLARQAAREARNILDQVPSVDEQYAGFTFQFPIFDRDHNTWGTVHYEPKIAHLVIRLRNAHSEHLKLSAERLVENVASAHARGLTFHKVRVLEPLSQNEAFVGHVRTGSTARATIKDRKKELAVAAIFFAFAVAVVLGTSPWAADIDHRLNDTQTDGWLEWVGGNAQRIGSAFVVSALLPIVNVILHYLDVRRQAVIRWSVDDV